MSILPKSSKEFADKKYWDKFFKHRDKSFEWYGSYGELSKILHKYVKPSHALLIVGCGNSTLSSDLYDDGFENNTSIDISDVAIEKMIAAYKSNGIRQRLRFECMDVFHMSYHDETFNAVIDKGTLDALSSSEELDLAQMFAQIERVLKPLGRYVCVSLLQEHVANKLFSWFFQHGSWIVQIERCSIESRDDENHDSVEFPVFMIVCTKLKQASQRLPPTVQVDVDGSGHFVRHNDVNTLISSIKAVQEIEFVKFYIRSNKLVDDNFYLELFGDGDSEHSRYTLFFVRKSSVNHGRSGAVFIVPRGRSPEWLFSTGKGRAALLARCSVDRLIVVHLSRDHHYDNIEQIKDELSARMHGFFPKTFSSIPFLTLGEDIGEVNILFEGCSQLSGAYVVEDVTIDECIVRRLIFLSNRNIIQSEVNLKIIQTKHKHKTKMAINTQFLSCDHHKFIAAGLSLPNRIEQKAFHIVIIGLGGGCFVDYLNHNFTLPHAVNLTITVVEIDPEMVQVARKWFDFGSISKKNIKIEIVIMDGIKFIQQAASDRKEFDFIVFDVDSKNLDLGISCPPQEFVQPSFVQQVSQCLNANGLFILNLVARNDDLKQSVHQTLSATFASCLAYQMEEDLNEIIFCFNHDRIDWLGHKSVQARKNYLKSSLFHLNILTATYNKLCQSKLNLL